MKIYFFLLISGFLLFSKSHGQSLGHLPISEWHKGALVLNSHDVVRGKVKYNHTYDAVLLQTDGKISTYSASQVIYFYYIHNPTGVVYDYVALPYDSQKNKTYRRYYFFEILLEGKVPYLRKANKKAQIIDHKDRRRVYPKLNVDKSCYDYYMLYNEEVVCINNFAEDALPLLAQVHPERIHAFIREKNMEDFTPHERLVILHYYNALHGTAEQQEVAALHKYVSETNEQSPSSE